mgnify:FL=1
MTYSYPTTLNIHYSNNTEFRNCLRQIFKMDFHNFPNTDNLDKETADEIMYDSQAATTTMNFIFSNTKNNPLFTTLYEKSASFMFSTDIEIGLTILFSYDYLQLFHSLLVVFFSNDSSFNLSTSSEYYTLYTKLFK